MTKLPIIRLRPKEGRRMRAGAPWVFSNEILMDAAAKALEPGSVVRLADSGGELLGTGYFNPQSLIAVRLLGAADLDVTPEFFAQRLRTALALRTRLFDEPFYRLVHAEGDDLPGVTIDRFGDVLVLQITTAGMERLTDTLLPAVQDVLAPSTVVLRNDAPARALEGLASSVQVVKGGAARLTVQENGAVYFADPAAGQKSGWYYDQRENRAFMAKFAASERVLDAYSYTGGFGILAARAGAHEVIAVDSSEPALALARDAAEANTVAARCRFVKADVFEELERRVARNETFGVVICDPPPFVRARKDLEPGSRAYRKLARLAASLTAPGGFLFLASCSHNIPRDRFALECAAGIARAGRKAAIIRDAGAGPDHPVHPMLPETAYLKALVFRVE
jgi:23S rRNA (cytosine1962-C5)-methyltransferase